MLGCRFANLHQTSPTDTKLRMKARACFRSSPGTCQNHVLLESRSLFVLKKSFLANCFRNSDRLFFPSKTRASASIISKRLLAPFLLAPFFEDIFYAQGMRCFAALFWKSDCHPR